MNNRFICDCKFSTNDKRLMINHAITNKHGWKDTKPRKRANMGRSYVGSVGVDSGNIIICDPCYIKGMPDLISNDHNQWLNFCDNLENHDHNPHEYKDGIVSSTYCGDGNYPVYATFDKLGKVKKLEIIFTHWQDQQDLNKLTKYSEIKP